MKQNFTTNGLIKYLYKETSFLETLEIDAALEEDLDLSDKFKSLMVAYSQLPKVTFSPSSNAIQNILDYNAHSFVERA